MTAITYPKIKSLSLLFTELLTINGFILEFNHYRTVTMFFLYISYNSEPN